MRRNLIFLLFSLAIVSITSADYQYDYFSDRISREFRNGYDVEDWIERGNATVTASPSFEDGVRLTAWAGEYAEGENYEFAIASAIYHFEIPHNCQYVEIRLRYRGESTAASLNDYDDVAGRVWVRNTKEPDQRYQKNDNEETRYGDTFILRAKRRAETIKIPAANHVERGLMELHVVVDGSGQIDVESITVSAYRHQPEIRIVERHADNYRWQPWHRYSYLYFYNGPIYYTYPDHYLAWHYPARHHLYVSMRRSYNRTTRWYYKNRRPPYRRYGGRPANSLHIHLHDTYSPKRSRLSSWSDDYETTHQAYRQRKGVASALNRNTSENGVQAVMERHRTQPSLSQRQIKDRLVKMKRRQLAARHKNEKGFGQMRSITSPQNHYSGQQDYGSSSLRQFDRSSSGNDQRQRHTSVSRSSRVLEKHRSLRSHQRSARQQMTRRSSSSVQSSGASKSSKDDDKEKRDRGTNTQRTRRR